MPSKKIDQGFTLVELLVVVAIIAVLAVIGVATFSNLQKSSRDSKRVADLKTISSALEIYYQQKGSYAPTTNSSCSNNWVSTFNHPTYGVVGTAVGCPASLKNGLSSSFAGGVVPQDPLCSGTSCSSGQPDYILDTSPNNGASYTISAKLETPPSPPVSGCYSGYNYCLKNQQ